MKRNHSVACGWMIAGVSVALVACEGRVVELATANGGMGESAVNGVDAGSSTVASYGGIPGALACTKAPIPRADAGSVSGATLASLVGTWKGYAETGDDMTLVFTPQADGSVTGSLTFGTGSPPAPTTSKTVWPQGYDGTASAQFPYPGFPYTATDISFDGTRLQLGVVGNELMKTWCGLQTSFDWAPNSPGMCACLPDWAGMGSTTGTGSCSITNPTTGAAEAIPCALFGPCGLYFQVCSCDATGCSVDMQNSSTKLDVQLASNKLDGSISGLQPSALNAHFTRSP